MPEDPAAGKKELLEQIESAEEKAKELESLGQQISESARFMRDVAGPVGNLIRQTPAEQWPAQSWHQQAMGWQAWGDKACRVLSSAVEVNSLSAMSQVVANTTIT